MLKEEKLKKMWKKVERESRKSVLRQSKWIVGINRIASGLR